MKYTNKYILIKQYNNIPIGTVVEYDIESEKFKDEDNLIIIDTIDESYWANEFMYSLLQNAFLEGCAYGDNDSHDHKIGHFNDWFRYTKITKNL